MGGRSASTWVASPYGKPVTTGKAGIHLAPVCSEYSQSLLPVLCRQATSCERRHRLRKIPDRRFRCSRGSAKARSGQNPQATLATQMLTSRNRPGILGGLGGPDGQMAIQEAQRNRTAKRARRHVQCGCVETCARTERNLNTFKISTQDAEIGPGAGRAWTMAPLSDPCCDISVACLLTLPKLR